MEKHSQYFNIADNVIVASYPGSMQRFGWINKIQIGEPDDDITLKISEVTHDMKGKYQLRYEPNLGYASGGRFASPIYVSVLSDGETPIITSLNTIPDKGKQHLDMFIQDEFKKQLLG